ncbi:MAG TPA: hypothetical protein VFR64_11295 [Methylomirabilota bacterium]|nr:hypothetical protein [Methylomirabilota bacterium]
MGGAVRVSRPPRVSASLALARYRVSCEAVEPRDLPAYPGSTLHLIFETAPPPGAEALSTHEEIPRPFVIAPPPLGSSDYLPGSVVSFGLGGDRIEP